MVQIEPIILEHAVNSHTILIHEYSTSSLFTQYRLVTVFVSPVTLCYTMLIKSVVSRIHFWNKKILFTVYQKFIPKIFGTIWWVQMLQVLIHNGITFLLIISWSHKNVDMNIHEISLNENSLCSGHTSSFFNISSNLDWYVVKISIWK